MNRASGTSSAEAFIVVEESGERPRTLQLSGVVDIARARVLLDAARSCCAGCSSVAIECSTVERLDAAGLQVLLALAKKLRDMKLDVRLRRPSDAVTAAVRLAGVATELPTDEAP
jgi:anti-anti-sigma factor